jgi:hypothetical protein
MDIAMESFHFDGAKQGALIRRRTGTELRTMTAFAEGDEIYHVRHDFVHSGDPFAWTSYTYASGDDPVVTVNRTSPHAVEFNGQEFMITTDSIPSYAAHLLLEQAVHDPQQGRRFHQLQDADPSQTPTPTRFSPGAPDAVALPDGTQRTLPTMVLLEGDRPTNRFWFDDQTLVASDWQGATSYPAASPEDLLSGLTDPIQRLIRKFCA